MWNNEDTMLLANSEYVIVNYDYRGVARSKIIINDYTTKFTDDLQHELSEAMIGSTYTKICEVKVYNREDELTAFYKVDLSTNEIK